MKEVGIIKLSKMIPNKRDPLHQRTLEHQIKGNLIRHQLPTYGKLKLIAKVISILKSKEATLIVDLILSIKQKGT